MLQGPVDQIVKSHPYLRQQRRKSSCSLQRDEDRVLKPAVQLCQTRASISAATAPGHPEDAKHR